MTVSGISNTARAADRSPYGVFEWLTWMPRGVAPPAERERPVVTVPIDPSRGTVVDLTV